MGVFRFAFFAPTVPGWYSIRIYGRSNEGEVSEFKLPQPNREIEIRYNRMVRNIQDDKLREPMLRSIANYVKRKHPEVDSVNFQIFHIDTPTMEKFKRGESKTHKLVYNLSF